MSDFVLHPDALVDIEEIWQFVAADSLEAELIAFWISFMKR